MGGAHRALDRSKVKAWVSTPGSRHGQGGKVLANSICEAAQLRPKGGTGSRLGRPNTATPPIGSAKHDAAHKRPPLRDQHYVAPERSQYKAARKASALGCASCRPTDVASRGASLRAFAGRAGVNQFHGCCRVAPICLLWHCHRAVLARKASVGSRPEPRRDSWEFDIIIVDC